ncbi:hypothetical protein KUTeg_021412 [Tegillarca granosa]|uniref:Uncharacterized protein n=1 Tax=Tegillarca granosa TaxID=220873 RepID=A0ABQ9E9A9_TEGGR|nr:hypothetical protein KUTeg_021412 [Tegillarca granosa]
MQIRVSPDYHSQADQWKIGVTSILADAVGLVPYKDTFWTTTNQPGNPKYPTITEPYPSLEALVATLSTGPVGPGDKINSTDVDMLMRYVCKMAIPDSDGPVGEVWTTYSVIQEVGIHGFGILLAADMKQPYTIYPKDTGLANIVNTLF